VSNAMSNRVSSKGTGIARQVVARALSNIAFANWGEPREVAKAREVAAAAVADEKSRRSSLRGVGLLLNSRRGLFTFTVVAPEFG